MPVVAAKSPRTHRTRDQIVISVRTAPAGADRHQHCACFDEYGRGQTSPGSDGHVHPVRACEVLAAPDGHLHQLSAQRCTQRHDRNGRHVV